MAKKTKTGRPAGSPNKERDTVVGEATRCAKCGSTNRTPYLSCQELEFAGLDLRGRPFTHVVTRRTSCADCGQHRFDKHFENRPKK